MKDHPSIAPLVRGGDLVEYSAHVIPEGGLGAMPDIVTDGMLVAGDAAGLTLAAGIWLEGVNFAIGSGAAAGETAVQALARGDVTAAGLQGYRTRLEQGFVLADHRKLRRVPSLLLSERVQRRYPELACTRRRGAVHRPQPDAEAGPGPHRAGRAAPVRGAGARRRPRRLDGMEELWLSRPSRRNCEPPPSRSRRCPSRTGWPPWSSGSHPTPTSSSTATAAGVARRGRASHVCPANLFAPTADGGILFNYEECFECGSCYLVCNEAGAITWTYPEGGHGVVFHRS